MKNTFILGMALNLALSSNAFAIKALVDTKVESMVKSSTSTAELLINNYSAVTDVSKGEIFVNRNLPFKATYFFNVPKIEIAPLSQETLTAQSNEVIIADQNKLRYSTDSNGRLVAKKDKIQNQMGLRWTVLRANNDKASRQRAAKNLANSGMVKTGDIILSFRPEWYGTLKYSHIQMGISHASMALVKNETGTKNLYNIDMPLDSETWGGKGTDNLTAKHYVEAPYLHIVRPTALHDGVNDEQEAKNVAKWLDLIRDRASSFWKKSVSFNTDYMRSNYLPKLNGEVDLTFISDLARLSLGGKVIGDYPSDKGYSMYCSEFTWVVLSLKDCNPDTTAKEFLKGKTPACVKEIMAPMPVIGSYDMAVSDLQTGQRVQALTSSKVELGLADGPLLIAESMTRGQSNSKRLGKIIDGFFTKADGKASNISSGHKAVEAGLQAKNPMFFQLIQNAYKLAGNFNIIRKAFSLNDAGSVMNNPQARTMVEQMTQIQLGFNERIVMGSNGQPVIKDGKPVLKQGPLNYSPTAFMVHALIPRGESIKAFQYVTSIMVMPTSSFDQMVQKLK